MNSLTNGGAAVITPNQESIKEVRVIANVYSAEYGRNSGAQVLTVSQNGTNNFHGSLFMKNNSPGLNALNKYGGPNNAAKYESINSSTSLAAVSAGQLCYQGLVKVAHQPGTAEIALSFSFPMRASAAATPTRSTLS